MASSDWLEVADRVWMRRYDPLDVNVTVIDGELGRVLVDTRGSMQQGLEIRHDLAALGQQPILAVVNTHHHFDHVYGNQVFQTAPLIGHVRAAEILADEGEQRRQTLYDWLPEDAHPEIDETTITPPTTLVTDDLFLTLGNRSVDVLHCGRAHTDNDLVVHIPETSTLIAGDILEQSGPPSMDDAYPMEWPDTVARALERRPATVVPGHGRAMTLDEATQQHHDLQVLADLLARLRARELTVAELVASSPFPEHHTRTALSRP